MWQWIGKNNEQLKIAFAVVAAFYAIVEYHLKIHEDKVSQALTYIERHSDGKVFEARSRIAKFWLSKKGEEWLNTFKSTESPQVRKARYEKELPDLIKSENSIKSEKSMTEDLYLLLEYYASVALCVKSEHCDSKTICQNLFIDVQAYRQDYEIILDKWKKDLGETNTDEIAYLTENSCAAQFANYCIQVPASSYCQKR